MHHKVFAKNFFSISSCSKWKMPTLNSYLNSKNFLQPGACLQRYYVPYYFTWIQRAASLDLHKCKWKMLRLIFCYLVRCTTFLEGLENEFNGHVGEINDTLPNNSYHYEDQLRQFSKFEMHAFTKMTVFLDFPLFYYRKQQKTSKVDVDPRSFVSYQA